MTWKFPLLKQPGFHDAYVYIRGELATTNHFWSHTNDPAALGSPRDYLGGGFKYFVFSPLFGEDSHFD